jgi:hypothetical protein
MGKHLVCSASTSCCGAPLDNAAESFVELRVARHLHFAVFRFIAMVECSSYFPSYCMVHMDLPSEK